MSELHTTEATDAAASLSRNPGVVTGCTTYRVLFVDDEESVMRVCKTILERKGCSVHAFPTSEAALKQFEATPDDFDVILTDLSLPGMTGIAFAKALRQVRANVPIIIMSGYGPADVMAEAKAVGVDHVIGKPIELKSFVKLVTEVAANGRNSANGAEDRESGLHG